MGQRWDEMEGCWDWRWDVAERDIGVCARGWGGSGTFQTYEKVILGG